MSSGFTELRDSGALIQLAHKAMLSMGVDVETVYERLGVSVDMLSGRHVRTPHEAQLVFWDVLEDVTKDPFIGLHLGEKIPVYHGQVLQYLFLSSATFGDGLRRALNYQRLLSDAAMASLVVEGECAYLTIQGANQQVAKIRHVSDCMALGLIKFFQYVTDGRFQPLSIHFAHQGCGDVGEYQRVFGCEVKFKQGEYRICFDAKWLGLTSLHAEPELLQLHEKLASEHVAKLEKQDIITQVYRAFAEMLETGQVSLDDVAGKIGIKPRTLRTRLSEADTNFNQLLANYRCNLAKRLLASTTESIDNIVYLTGFSEPSTFYRAFKRWTQQTPVEYRKKRQS